MPEVPNGHFINSRVKSLTQGQFSSLFLLDQSDLEGLSVALLLCDERPVNSFE